jgi:uncharacterized protein with von Willebrand factor type A (vWA) domain
VELDAVVAIDLSFELSAGDLWAVCRDAATAALDLLAQAGGGPPELIGYSQMARSLSTDDLPGLHHDYTYGTNVHDALRMARRSLDKSLRPGRVLFIADTEPTAHVQDDGEPFSSYPPVPETAARTLSAARQSYLAGHRVDVLLLQEGSAFGPLAAEITSACGGALGVLSDAGDRRAEVAAFLSQIGMIWVRRQGGVGG